MNQSNSIKRTSISFGLVVLIALVALSIQNFQKPETINLEAEAKVYPKKVELFQK
jgi:hypothetical protein